MKNKNYNGCTLRPVKRSCLFLLISFTLVSCGFQGRKYTKGFFLTRSDIHPSESIQSKADFSNSELALLEGADEISLTLIPSIKSDSLNSVISNAVQSIQPIQASNSISISNDNIENDTLKLGAGARMERRERRARRRNDGGIIYSNDQNIDSTKVNEIIDLNRKFKKSSASFLINGLISIIFSIISYNHASPFFFAILAFILSLSLLGTFLSLIYNGYITFRLGRKLKKFEGNLPYDKWIYKIRVKVILLKLFVYFPLIFLGGLMLILIITILAGSLPRF